jgi:hypothetical protein
MEESLLLEYIKNEQTDNAIQLLEIIGQEKRTEYTDLLIDSLPKIKERRLRNAIVITIGDIAGSRAIDPLIKELLNAQMLGSNGTVLYTLDALNYVGQPEIFINYLTHGNFEERFHAFQILGRMAGRLSLEEREQAHLLLRLALSQCENDDQRELLEEALEIVENQG